MLRSKRGARGRRWGYNPSRFPRGGEDYDFDGSPGRPGRGGRGGASGLSWGQWPAAAGPPRLRGDARVAALPRGAGPELLRGRAVAPRVRSLGTARQDGERRGPGLPVPGLSGHAGPRARNPTGAGAWRLDRRGDGRALQPPSAAPGAGGPRGDQGVRPHGAGHPGNLCPDPSTDTGGGLARPWSGRRADEAAGNAGPACGGVADAAAEPGVGSPLYVEAVHAQSQSAPVASAHHRADAADLGRERRHREHRLWARAFQQSIPGAGLQVIPEAGHYPYLEQPDAFVEAVAGFAG